MVMDFKEKLNLSYDGKEYQGSWCRIDLATDEMIAYDVIETEYLDRLLLFVRVNWAEELDYAFKVVYNLKKYKAFRDTCVY